MKRYKKYMTPYLSAFIIGPLLMLTEVVGEIMLPKLMSLIINNGVAGRDIRYIMTIGIVMVLTTFVMALGGIGGAYFSAKASICFTSDLREDLFAKVQEFSFKNIDNYSTGSLVTRLTNDIQQIQNVVMMGLRLMLRAPGMFVGALIMAFIMNARLAIVILVVIPLLSLAIVGMVFAYNTESGDKKSQEKEEQQVAFQEVEKDKETAKDEVEDVSSILKAKQKQEEQQQEQKKKAETQKEEASDVKEEPKVQETASKPSALTFKGELAWPAAEEGKVIMNYSMDQTVYFKSLDQYRYNPAVIIGAKVNDKVTSAAAGSVLEVSNNEVTGCTVTVNLGDGYKAIYGQLKEVSKKAGDYVAPGEVIGYISEPTKYYSEEGSNLYFELQKDDQPVDPMGYFK